MRHETVLLPDTLVALSRCEPSTGRCFATVVSEVLANRSQNRCGACPEVQLCAGPLKVEAQLALAHLQMYEAKQEIRQTCSPAGEFRDV